jgi:hypothetical protein
MSQTKQALVIKATNEIEIINFTNETSYEVISGAVGGYIEAITFEPTITMWGNEEAKLNKLPYNHKATSLWRFYFGNTDLIAGDVVITGGADSEGDSNGLSMADTNKLQVLVGSVGEPSQEDLELYDRVIKFFS